MSVANNSVDTENDTTIVNDENQKKGMMLPAVNLDEDFWDELLAMISEGRVVPVIGSQLFAWGEPDNPQSLQRAVAERLLLNKGVSSSSIVLNAHRELHQAVSYLVSEKHIAAESLYFPVSKAMQEVIDSPDFQEPLAINQLAEISDFRLMVTLAPNILLAKAILKHRAVNEIIHSPKLSSREGKDLPDNWLSQCGETYLLYLFGKVGSSMVYAIHDEDILEYAHNLISHGNDVPMQFLKQLQERSLLLIGCNFPDWLSRFFIRLTHKDRLGKNDNQAWLVEDVKSQTDLTLFLKSYSRETKILSDLSPQAFVAELHKRWLCRHLTSGTEKEFEETVPQHGILFFISYSRQTDLPAVENLLQELLKVGVSENEIWYDRHSIEPGDDFKMAICKGIKNCRYFLPLISKAADKFPEKYFYREWCQATDRKTGFGVGEKFIVPVIVDENFEPEGYKHVPPEWNHSDFVHAPTGLLTEEMRKSISVLIQDARNPNKSTGSQSQEIN